MFLDILRVIIIYYVLLLYIRDYEEDRRKVLGIRTSS